MRKALNANLLTDWIEKHYEIKSKIISQEEEIRYVYYAARHFQSGEEAYLAIDIGGFSTEFIDLGNDEKIQGIGLPFGLMTLLNEFDVNCDTATKYIQDPVSYTHLRAHETVLDLVCRLLLEKTKKKIKKTKTTNDTIIHIK